MAETLSAEEIAAMRREIDALPQPRPVRPEWDVYRIVATLEMQARERDELRAKVVELEAGYDRMNAILTAAECWDVDFATIETAEDWERLEKRGREVLEAAEEYERESGVPILARPGEDAADA